MSEFLQRLEKLSPKRLALLAADLQDRLTAATAANDPVAIIGIGCRLPGGVLGPDAFWELLANGGDAVTEVPRGRWDIDAYYHPDPDHAGTMSSRWGGFIDDIAGFDAAFFGISPREASTMDPQQRLLLEVCWEALENAGQSPARLAGTETGVYAGLSTGDYHQMMVSREVNSIDAYLATGSAHSIAAGRISYCLGLEGPNVALDTACSSSLVAVHLACMAIRNRDCDLAVAGGVNAILSPQTTITLSKAHMMAPDGRCKAFDESANGFVRSEGCGIVVLKRLSNAMADGDRVLCTIRGSAINQDGRSSGITAPNGAAQERVIRRALHAAGLEPNQVGYVETHGTGTSLGDPIEAHALAAVFGAGREPGDPLLIGSVKANLGHLEAAAGIAGLIKAALCVEKGLIPAQLHFRKLNPHIKWNGASIQVSARRAPWDSGKPRIAGVSSFGFGGTNAHVLIEQAPAAAAELKEPEAPSADRPLHLLAVSARSPVALAQLVERHRWSLESRPHGSLADICYTAGAGRAHLAYRAAFIADSLPALQQSLAQPTPFGPAAGFETEPVFMFAGEGAACSGMDSRLYQTQPVFREALDRCHSLMARHGLRPPGTGAIFAFEFALSELWISWGVRPAAVLGHGLGEYAAACVAGVLTLEDGCALVAERARLTAELPSAGAATVVVNGEDAVRRWIQRVAPLLDIAAVNAPDSTVVSGSVDDIAKFEAAIASAGLFFQRLAEPAGFHSRWVEPMLPALQRFAATLQFSRPKIPFVSSVIGSEVASDVCQPAYWSRQARQPVQFQRAVRDLVDRGHRLFLEVGPGSVLCEFGGKIAPEVPALWLSSLRQGRDEWRQMLETLASLYTQGCAVDWAGFDRPYRRRKTPLPTYPFEHRAFWLDPPQPKPTVAGAGIASRSWETSSALGHRLNAAIPTFEVQVSLDRFEYLSHHRLGGRALLPGSFFLEMAMAASRALFSGQAPIVSDFAILSPVYLAEPPAATTLQLVVPDAEKREFSIYARIYSGTADETDWHLCVTGRLSPETPAAGRPVPVDLSAVRQRLPAPSPPADFYAALENAGISIGPRFQAIAALSIGEHEGIAEIALPEELSGQGGEYVAHPVLLDAVLQTFGALLVTANAGTSANAGPSLSVLSEIARVRADAPVRGRLSVHVRQGKEAMEGTGQALVVNQSGEVVLDVSGIRVRRSRAPQPATEDPAFWRIEWKDRERRSIAPGPKTALPSPDRYVSELVQAAPQLAASTGFDRYDGFGARLNLLCASLGAGALGQMGMSFQPGRRFSTAGLMQQLGIVKRYSRLTHRMLEILSEDGILASDGTNWIVRESPAVDAAGDAFQDSDASLFSAELAVTRRCGAGLAGVMRGEIDPLSLLFPEGAVESADRLYSDSPSARVFHSLLKQALGFVVHDNPGKTDWRILEIGAGTGGATAYALPAFEGRAAEYAFTDISPVFLARARERFAGSSCLRTALFNTDKGPDTQGFSPGAYDVVVAANVLHAAADLRGSINNAARLVRPGGWIALIEGTRPERWVDLTFGLTDGWWRFEDTDLRPGYPLVDIRQWTTLLQQSGFEKPIAVRAGDSQQVLLIARMPAEPAVRSTWLLIPDRDGVSTAAAAEFEKRGHLCFHVDEKAASDQLQRSDAAGVVDFRPLDMAPGIPSPSGLREHQKVCAAVAGSLSRFRMRKDGKGSRFWVVTRGGVVAGDQRVASPGQGLVWGLARTAALEMPEVWGGSVDLDPSSDAIAQAAALVEELLHPDNDYEVAFRARRRLVPRVVPCFPPLVPEPRIRPDGAYLITGGLGALGLKVALRLAEMGARRLFLLGRTGLPERNRWAEIGAGTVEGRRIEVIRTIEYLGARVEWVIGDITNEAEMRKMLGRFGHTDPALSGVVHAAAHFDSTPLDQLTPALLDAVVAPKAMGAVLLGMLTATHPIDFLVLFSSTTALLGAKGLAHYAAANEFMNVFAEVRRWEGRPALSLNWGIWDDLSAATEQSRQHTLQSGLIPMKSASALDALVRLLGSRERPMAVASVNWRLLRSQYEARRSRPLLEEMKPDGPSFAIDAAGRAGAAGPSDALLKLAQLPSGERFDYVARCITDAVAGVLRLPAAEVPRDVGLFDLGMDSLMSIEVRSRLDKVFACSLPSTVTFNYPTIAALTGLIFAQLTPSGLASERTAVAVSGDVSKPAPGAEEEELSEWQLAEMLADSIASIEVQEI